MEAPRRRKSCVSIVSQAELLQLRWRAVIVHQEEAKGTPTLPFRLGVLRPHTTGRTLQLPVVTEKRTAKLVAGSRRPWGSGSAVSQPSRHSSNTTAGSPAAALPSSPVKK